MTPVVDDAPPGKDAACPQQYAPGLLLAIPRSEGRAANNIDPATFSGVDLWTAYEISWLDSQGKPQVRVGYFSIPGDSENLIESKSFKLYLNSLNNSTYNTDAEVVNVLRRDLSTCAGAEVDVTLAGPDEAGANGQTITGNCLDQLQVSVKDYSPFPAYLCTQDGQIVEETLYSHLLKTNCPVTGQPDWATLWLTYRGPRIERTGLLQYLVSYRNHQDFHEQCVERIFCDIWERCKPVSLQVYARYTRRGGLDINPFRSSEPDMAPPLFRVSRQ